MTGKEIVLLTDYRGFFYGSSRHPDASMQVDILREAFSRLGYGLDIQTYGDLDPRRMNFNGQIVLYQSADDRHLLYKSYIEDIVLGLHLQGALLVPRFEYFRAHHNKHFMEILRDISDCELVKNIRSLGYGTYEDFVSQLSQINEPMVMKASEGAKGTSVYLGRTARELRHQARRISRTFHLVDDLKNLVKTWIRPYHVSRSNHRAKFILQTFVPDLRDDYKIVIYGSKYYVLRRLVRKDDFRASGSGRFQWPSELPDGLLDFARTVYKSFDTPFLSIDVGHNGKEHFLFEFQFLCFGNTPLEKSPNYFSYEEGKWVIHSGKSILEEEFASAVCEYLRNRMG